MLKGFPYENLSARQKEVFNFHKVAATLADYGFNCLKLTDDWQGADFLAYHVNGAKSAIEIKSHDRQEIQRERYLDRLSA